MNEADTSFHSAITSTTTSFSSDNEQAVTDRKDRKFFIKFHTKKQITISEYQLVKTVTGYM